MAIYTLKNKTRFGPGTYLSQSVEVPAIDNYSMARISLDLQDVQGTMSHPDTDIVVTIEKLDPDTGLWSVEASGHYLGRTDPGPKGWQNPALEINWDNLVDKTVRGSLSTATNIRFGVNLELT